MADQFVHQQQALADAFIRWPKDKKISGEETYPTEIALKVKAIERAFVVVGIKLPEGDAKHPHDSALLRFDNTRVLYC